MTRLITYNDTIHRLSWPDAVEALRQGHMLPRAEVSDAFLGPADGTLLSRSAYIAGLGYGVKSVTVFGANPAWIMGQARHRCRSDRRLQG